MQLASVHGDQLLVRLRTNLSLNRPFPSSPEPLYQNEVKCSAFDMEMIFHSRANKTHSHKKDCALGFILKVTVFGTLKWPIVLPLKLKVIASLPTELYGSQIVPKSVHSLPR